MTLTDPVAAPRADARTARPVDGAPAPTAPGARPSWFVAPSAALPGRTLGGLPTPAGPAPISGPTPVVTVAEPAGQRRRHRHVAGPVDAPVLRPRAADRPSGRRRHVADGPGTDAAPVVAAIPVHPTPPVGTASPLALVADRDAAAAADAPPAPADGAPVGAGLPTRAARRAAERARVAAAATRAHAATAVRPGNRRRLAGQAAVLAAVTVATVGFTTAHREVTVEVDGVPVHVEGYGRTVASVLASAGIAVRDGDLLAPALDATVADGGTVVLQHTREVTAEIDGQTRTWRTTAATVDEALDDLGLRGQDVLTSASRSAALGRDALVVSTPKTVRVAVDGQVLAGTSSAATVREALADLGLVLGEADVVSVPLDAAAVDGLVVVVTRAVQDGETVTEALPFETQRVDDPDLLVGTTKVVTRGKAGVRTTTYTREVVGEVVTTRTPLASAVTTAPVTEVVHVGTGTAPVVAAAPAARAAAGAAAPAVASVSPGSAQEIAHGMVLARGWGEDQFSCLVALWKKESGWNASAANRSSGAYGIPQALPGSKMASAGADWQTNPATQITWGLGYIAARYGTPCGAWSHSQSRGWY